MFDRLQVRGRLLLSFIGVSSFALIAAAVAIYSFLETGKGLDSITQRWVPSALASQELSRQTERIVALAPASLAVTTAEQHEAISGDIAAEVEQFDELLFKVGGRGNDPAQVISIERDAAFIEGNLETLDGLVADHLTAAAHIQELLGTLANANMGAQRLLTPGIRALDGEVSQLRRILADPDLSAAEHPARVAALAQSIAAAAPLRRTQNEFSTINDSLIRAASAESQSDLSIFAHPLRRALDSLAGFAAEFDGGLKRRLLARAEELRSLTDDEDGILRSRGRELAIIAEIESLLARNADVSRQLTGTLDQLIAGTNQDIQIASIAAAQSQQRSTWILVAVVILSLAASILIVWLYVGRNLIARLGALNHSMMAIAGGNLEANIPTGGRDEISRMALALSGFRDTAIEVRETNLRELVEARRRLNDAIESISEGFSLFDPGDRLVVWNNRFQELLYPGREREIEPDTPFETVMREAMDSGYVNEVEGDADAWMAARITRHRAPSSQHLHQRRDARWIQVSEHKTDDGGTVAIHSDITELKQAEKELQDAYAVIMNQRDRMETELNVGREMQMSMVPRIFPAFPERQEFSIHGFLQPAREMGGDFYDFFFIDADRLCFCIGDVSGKGVSAALFMAVTKTLIKSHAPNDPSTASILTHVNGELCLDNENAMFVTLFIGILNTRTGALDYANAGHNPPYLKRRDGSAQKLMPHGPVAGVADGHVYDSGRETLGPGDLVYMYTDGVTEEINGEGQFFSDKRLERIVCAQTLRSAKAIVDDTVMAVEQFRGQKEAEDDVTVLAIEFMGDAPNRQMAENLHITVQNELSQIALAENMFGEFAAAHGLPEELVRKMGAILDDVLNNVISYAYSDNRDHAIEITATRRDDRVIVTISDDGTPFNPLLHAAPEACLSLEDRRVGGLGIHLVRHLADDISYRRRTEKNELTLTLLVDPPDDQP